MAILAKDSGGGDFTPCPAGTHFAICNMVVDLGHQMVNFEGKETIQRKVFLRWELPDELMDGGAPFTIGRSYTLSLSSKATLRNVLEAWRGKPFTKDELEGFDIESVLGTACQLQVIHDEKGDKTYANVKAVIGLSKGDKARAKDLKPHNQLVTYSIDTPNPQVFESLPKWLKEKITNRVEAPGKKPAQAAPVVDPDLDDDIPF